MHPTIGAALVFQGTHPPPQGPNPNRLRPCGAVWGDFDNVEGNFFGCFDW
jgi:hypothetical protein